MRRKRGISLPLLALVQLILLGTHSLSVSASDSDQEQRLKYQLIYSDSESDQRDPPGDVVLLLLDSEVQESDKDLHLDQRTLIKLHGVFMVIAWMGTTTIGVLIARLLCIVD